MDRPRTPSQPTPPARRPEREAAPTVADAVAVNTAPVAPETVGVDGPSLVPDASTIPGGRLQGNPSQDSLAPDVTPADPLADAFGGRYEPGPADKGVVGTSQLDLPTGPEVIDLGANRGHEIESGINLDQRVGTLDGRGLDVFDGVSQSGSITPADPGAMTGDGANSLTTGATNGTFGDWLTSIVGGQTEVDKKEAAADAVIDILDSSTGDGGESAAPADPAVRGITTPGVNYTDGEGVASNVTAPEGALADLLSGVGKLVTHQNNIDGSVSEHQKQMDQVTHDGLPPDHPDYVGPPSAVPPGSAPAEGIQQSILLGLGGQRGGDIDPQDDTEPATSGEMIYDPYNSVVDPGPDGFTTTVDVDRSLLGGPMDAVAPELADE